MIPLERLAVAIRRAIPLPSDHTIWRLVRPSYRRVLERFGQHSGLERRINGTDLVRVPPRLYNVPERYEPDVWRAIMREIRRGDVVADVGASIGVYTVALAKRVAPSGQVHAFEPEPEALVTLRQLIALNGVSSNVVVCPEAVGARSGRLAFVAGRESESHVAVEAQVSGVEIGVDVVTLDEVFQNRRLDLLKVDVEGYEEHVLRGATRLLSDASRAPRAMFIEVHPYAWDGFGASSDSLLGLLAELDYRVTNVFDEPVRDITAYGEIVARPVRPVRS